MGVSSLNGALVVGLDLSLPALENALTQLCLELKRISLHCPALVFKLTQVQPVYLQKDSI